MIVTSVLPYVGAVANNGDSTYWPLSGYTTIQADIPQYVLDDPIGWNLQSVPYGDIQRGTVAPTYNNQVVNLREIWLMNISEFDETTRRVLRASQEFNFQTVQQAFNNNQDIIIDGHNWRLTFVGMGRYPLNYAFYNRIWSVSGSNSVFDISDGNLTSSNSGWANRFNFTIYGDLYATINSQSVNVRGWHVTSGVSDINQSRVNINDLILIPENSAHTFTMRAPIQVDNSHGYPDGNEIPPNTTHIYMWVTVASRDAQSRITEVRTQKFTMETQNLFHASRFEWQNLKWSWSRTLTPASDSIFGEKTIHGPDWYFDFILERYVDGSWVQEGVPVSNAEYGGFVFTNIPLTTIGTHDFRISEVVPYTNPYQGWTFDETVYYIRYTTNRVGLGIGVQSRVISYTKGGEPISNQDKVVFVNSYEAIGSIIFSGIKYAERQDLSENQFTFILTERVIDPHNSTFEPHYMWVERGTATNNVDPDNRRQGVFTFDKIPLDNAYTRVFRIRECPSAAINGWQVDPTIFEITVDVFDNELGNLIPDKSITKSIDGGITFKAFHEDDPAVSGNRVFFSNTFEPDIRTEVHIDTIQLTSAAFVDPYHVYDPNVGVTNNVGNEDERFRYDINFRSTSNVPADRFVVEIPLETVAADQLVVEGFWTPIVYGSVSGLFDITFVTEGGFHIETGLTVDVRHSFIFEEIFDEDTKVTAILLDYGAVRVGFTSLNTVLDSLNGEHRSESHEVVDIDSPSFVNIELIPSEGGFYLEPITILHLNEADEVILPQALHVFSYEGLNTNMGRGLMNSITESGINWTPNQDRPDYSNTAASATGLAPASFLVSAVKASFDSEFVKSVNTTIYRNFGEFSMQHRDQDAVLTTVIQPFSGGAETTEIPDYQVSFLENLVQNRPENSNRLRTPESPRNTELTQTHRRTNARTSPETGDDENLIIRIFTLLMVLSFGAGITTVFVKKRKQKVKSTILGMLFAILLVVPQTISSAAPVMQADGSARVEFRFLQGQRDQINIPERILIGDRVFVLTGVTSPVRGELIQDEVRTTTIIDGGIAAVDLKEIEGLPNLVVIPVIMRQEGVKSEIVTFSRLSNNCVTALPETHNGLDRAVVTFEVTNRVHGLPTEYEATVVFRGVQEFEVTAYYLVSSTFETSEITTETPIYSMIATFVPASVDPGGTTPGTTTARGQTPQVPVVPGDGADNAVDDATGGEVTVDEAGGTEDEDTLPTDEPTGLEDAEYSLEDPDVPLAPGPSETWALMNLLLSMGVAILMVIGLLSSYTKVRTSSNKTEVIKRWAFFGFITVVPTALTFIIFALTQHTLYLMILTDNWTVLFTIIFLIQVGIVAFVSKSDVVLATEQQEL